MLRLRLAAWCSLCALVCLIAPALVNARAANSALQAAVVGAMRGQRGTAVVVDVRSGQLIASYHLNVAAQRVVAPGSSLKPFTLLALLESGKLDQHTALMCKRPLSVAGHRIDCTHPDTKQPLNPATALAYSCNSYFTTAALRLQPAQLRDSLVEGGFTASTSLAASESAGHVALANSPEQEQLQAIGEWGIEVTPLELVRGYRQLALLQAQHDPKLAPLFEGLEQSVEYGMGHAAQPPGTMTVAGKTGTAPAAEGPWTHAWFAGYAPAANPAIVLVVFLEKGHGGSDAAATAREIFAALAPSQTAGAVPLRPEARQ